MTLRPVEDSYGITRELKDDYERGTVLPGATTIPSHKGKHGAQLGREKRGPIPMIIDPDINGDSVVITPDKLDANRELLYQGASATDTYKNIARAGNKSASAKQSEADIAEGRPLVPRRRRTGVNRAAEIKLPVAKKEKENPTAPPEEVVEAEETPREPQGPTMDDKLDSILATVAKLGDALGKHAEAINDVMDRVDSLEMAPAEELAPPTPAAPPEPVKDKDIGPEPGDMGAVPPSTVVTFHFPDSQMIMSSRYHSVLRNNDTLVLVFDTDFVFGDRMRIPANLEKPYGITVNAPDGSISLRAMALYAGQVFNHGNYEYTVFALMGDDYASDG